MAIGTQSRRHFGKEHGARETRRSRRASGMIPRETGRGLSISGAHRVAAVEQFVGATLVVALPRTAPPSVGHCLGTTGPGGWSGDFLVADWDRRPSGRREWRRGAATQPGNDATPQGTHKGCPYGHRELKLLRSPPPPGPRHDPPRNWAGIVHQRRPPELRRGQSVFPLSFLRRSCVNSASHWFLRPFEGKFQRRSGVGLPPLPGIVGGKNGGQECPPSWLPFRACRCEAGQPAVSRFSV